MRSLNLIRCAAVFMVLFSLSCKKRGQFEVPCKIETITSRYQYDPNFPAEVNVSTFTHNAWGDPVSIIQSVPGTGRPHYYFYYDNQHRLTAFKGEYEPGNIDSYSRYFYENNHFIVRDTTYYWGTDINNPASFNGIYTSTYSYDSKGRISKIVTKFLNTAYEFESNFAYDAQDNLITGDTYDNKTSYLRTSLVLAFVTHNYSKNNVSGALTYNSKNLPTSFPTAGIGGAPGPAFFNTPVTEVEYTCDNNDND